MVPPAGLLDLGEAEHIKEKAVVEIVVDEDAADLIKEELLRDRVDVAGEVAVADDHLDGVFVAVITDVLFDIILIRVKSSGVIIRPLFPV